MSALGQLLTRGLYAGMRLRRGESGMSLNELRVAAQWVEHLRTCVELPTVTAEELQQKLQITRLYIRNFQTAG